MSSIELAKPTPNPLVPDRSWLEYVYSLSALFTQAYLNIHPCEDHVFSTQRCTGVLASACKQPQLCQLRLHGQRHCSQFDVHEGVSVWAFRMALPCILVRSVIAGTGNCMVKKTMQLPCGRIFKKMPTPFLFSSQGIANEWATELEQA